MDFYTRLVFRLTCLFPHCCTNILSCARFIGELESDFRRARRVWCKKPFFWTTLSSFEIWLSVQCAWHASGVISLCCCILHAWWAWGIGDGGCPVKKDGRLIVLERHTHRPNNVSLFAHSHKVLIKHKSSLTVCCFGLWWMDQENLHSSTLSIILLIYSLCLVCTRPDCLSLAPLDLSPKHVTRCPSWSLHPLGSATSGFDSPLLLSLAGLTLITLNGSLIKVPISFAQGVLMLEDPSSPRFLSQKQKKIIQT